MSNVIYSVYILFVDVKRRPCMSHLVSYICCEWTIILWCSAYDWNEPIMISVTWEVPRDMSLLYWLWDYETVKCTKISYSFVAVDAWCRMTVIFGPMNAGIKKIQIHYSFLQQWMVWTETCNKYKYLGCGSELGVDSVWIEYIRLQEHSYFISYSSVGQSNFLWMCPSSTTCQI